MSPRFSCPDPTRCSYIPYVVISKLKLHSRILIHILIQRIQHIRILHRSMHRHTRPLSIFSTGVFYHTRVHAATFGDHIHHSRGERFLFVVLANNFHFEHGGIFHEGFEDTFLFASNFVCVECVTFVVVFGILHVVERFANADEAFLLAGGVGARCLNDGWCGVIGGGCGL